MTPGESGLAYWLNSYTHNGDAQAVCAWRKRAWRALRPVVAQFLADRENGCEVYAQHLIAGIELAAAEHKIKPTGKRWKKEVAELLGIVQRSRELWPSPSLDEYGACLVAKDLYAMADELERVGRAHEAKAQRDEALALMIKQAPGRHARPCSACGARIGDPCIELEAARHSAPVMRNQALRYVPHEARIAP